MSAVDELATLAVQGQATPDFAPGKSYAEKLLAGRDAALAALRQYVPDLKFDPAKADEVMAQVSAWEERNQAVIKATLQNPDATALPSQVAASLGAEKARQFVIAMFTQAAAGLGPWTSGAVGSDVASGHVVAGQPITAQWAETDALSRLQVFGAIVKMDQIGYLKTMFVPPAPGSTQGLGIFGVDDWIIVVAVVAVVALFAVLTYVYASKRLELNNKIMAERCKQAQDEGDKATVAQCIDAVKDLQMGSLLGPGFDQGVKTLLTAAAILGAGYVTAVFILPKLLNLHETKTRRHEAWTKVVMGML